MTARADGQKKGLNLRQYKFVAAFAGDALKAYLAAGYKDGRSAATSALHLLANPKVAAAIRARDGTPEMKAVLTRIERQQLWTRWALNEELDLGHRLRASELLGKSQCDFVERLDIDVQHQHRLPEGLTVEELRRLAAGNPQPRLIEGVFSDDDDNAGNS